MPSAAAEVLVNGLSILTTTSAVMDMIKFWEPRPVLLSLEHGFSANGTPLLHDHVQAEWKYGVSPSLNGQKGPNIWCWTSTSSRRGP